MVLQRHVNITDEQVDQLLVDNEELRKQVSKLAERLFNLSGRKNVNQLLTDISIIYLKKDNTNE